MSENKKLNQRLMEAIEKSDVQAVKELIKQGANLNIQYEEWSNKTPLIRSIEKGNDEIINLLLDNGALVNTQLLREEKFYETTALHEAVFRGKYDIIKKLIEKGAKINAKSYGSTALYYAIKKGYKDIAKLLIEKGANYNRENYEFANGRMQKGVTAFDLAKEEGNEEILDVITNKEKEKERKREEKRSKHINALKEKLQNDVQLKHKFSDKSIETYVDLKMGAVVDLKVLGKDDLDDLLALYNYNKEPKIEQTNYKEITQTEINEQLDAKKPVYIKVLSRIVDNQYKEHNETGAEWEIRKILRSEGESTLSKIESAKTGKTNQCFSMVNYGKVNPYNFEGVGLGAFQEDMEKIHLASEVDMSSLHHKGSDLISLNDEYYNSQNRDRENMKIDEKLNSMLDNLEKQEEVSEHNEIIMDVENKDIKFIFWLDDGKETGESWRKVKALYVQKKYKELSGRTVPIFRYKPGAKDYLKETDFSKEEIIDMLKKQVIDVEKKELSRGMDNEMFLDFLMTLKDEIDLIPESKEIIGKFIETKISEHSKPKKVIFESNIHNMINLAKYVGIVQGKDAQEKCIKKIFKNLELEIGVFLSTGVNYKGKRDNKKIDIMLELIAEIRGLEAYDNVKDFLEPKLNKVIENVKISKNKKAQKVYSLDKRGFNSRKNYTPLEYAIKKGNQEMVKILIENGADINTINKKGDTPLIYAVKKGNREAVKILIENGANVNVINEKGYDLLTYAMEKGNQEMVKILIENGVDVNAINKEGYTLLECEIEKGNQEMVKILIENGADVKAIDKRGYTPLTYAIQKGSKKMTRVLIEQGADINAMGKDGYTPLTYAIQKGNKEIMKMLLESGVDVNKKDGIGNTPISLAIKKGKFSISYLLIKRKVKCDLSRILSKLKLNKNIKHKSYKLQKEQKLDMQSIKELKDKLKNSKRDIANIRISSMDSDDSDITLNAKNRDKKEMTKKDMSKEFGRSKKMSREGLAGRNSYKPKKIHNVNNDKSFKI